MSYQNNRGVSPRRISLIARFWRWFRTPSRLAIGTLLLFGFVAGAVFIVSFNTSMTVMNSEEFCLSCHEMRDNVYQEYIETVHYSNRSGMKVICADCHIPQEFFPKIIRKVQATKELYGKLTGIIDTPQKFNEHRLAMAQSEWARMKANDSQECRNCHDVENMDLLSQKNVAAVMHREGFDAGKTCIDCHKGIAHNLPDMSSVPDDFLH